MSIVSKKTKIYSFAISKGYSFEFQLMDVNCEMKPTTVGFLMYTYSYVIPVAIIRKQCVHLSSL